MPRRGEENRPVQQNEHRMSPETQQGAATILRANTLEEAIAVAASRAVPGDVVVFSPGCSSFDMFANYEERGNRFKTIVKALAVERISG